MGIVDGYTGLISDLIFIGVIVVVTVMLLLNRGKGSGVSELIRNVENRNNQRDHDTE